MTPTRRAALAALLALGFGAAPARAEEPAAPPAPPPAPPREKAAPDESPEALEAMTAELMKEVERIRGLRFKAPVRRVWKSRDEARDEMLAEIARQYTPEELADESRAMAFFGFLKEGEALQKVFADFIGAGAGGYYIPEQKTFSLIRGFDVDGSKPIVFHELVHALEDQYFDFDARTKRLDKAKATDESLAVHALVEGSARTFENRYVDDVPGRREAYQRAQMRESAKQLATLLKLPAVLVIVMGVFPYENGSEFLAHVLPAITPGFEGGEVAALSSLFNDPPVSTEMILHPGKYLGARDLPQTVTLPDLAAVLGDGWRRLSEGTHGQLGVGLVLNAFLLPRGALPQLAGVIRPPTRENPTAQVIEFKGEAATAATGWDGDRYAVVGTAGDACLGWVSVWDTPADAGEFAAGYGKVLAKKYRDARREDIPAADGAPAMLRVTSADGAKVTVVRVDGSRVVIAEAVPAARADAVVAALLGAKVVQDPKDAVPAR